MAEDDKSPNRPDQGQTAARKPKVGDTIPAPVVAAVTKQNTDSAGGRSKSDGDADGATATRQRQRRRGGQNRSGGPDQPANGSNDSSSGSPPNDKAEGGRAGQRSQGSSGPGSSSQGSKGGGQRSGGQKAAGGPGSSETGGGSPQADSGQAKGGQRSGRAKSDQSQGGQGNNGQSQGGQGRGDQAGGQRKRRRSRGSGKSKAQQLAPVEAVLTDEGGPIELDESVLKQRKGRSRKGRALGRYQMNVHVTQGGATHVAILEGRQLVEYYAARPSDDETQIHGNIYLGRVENVLPGMEAAFIDIGTQKNAVLYRGDVQFDPEDVDSRGEPPRIEQLLKSKQMILCQVTKNPIAHKGARVTQEVSLPGRFVVMVPNSTTYGISKRLPDEERKRLRQILDKIRPPEHGIIVRTAAKGVTAEEIERDVARLKKQWEQIEQLASKRQRAGLLYREPELAARLIREEFNSEYRAVMIDEPGLYQEMSDYVAAITPEFADRVRYFDRSAESLPLFERFHVHEQLHRALDEKVWLPSGGSLVIQHTEALTVIDVNTGKNVGSSSLEETVFRNNLEAAEEIAKQLRLRDIGGIIVIDFVDMEIKDNRDQVLRAFKDALARDKTRTQVFPISDLGLVEMTRKRIGEGLLESFADECADCSGRGVVLVGEVLDDMKPPPGFQIRSKG
jgi:ribonuclease E